MDYEKLRPIEEKLLNGCTDYEIFEDKIVIEGETIELTNDEQMSLKDLVEYVSKVRNKE